MEKEIKCFNPIFKNITTEQLTESLKINARRVGCTKVTTIILEELILRYYDSNQGYQTYKQE